MEHKSIAAEVEKQVQSGALVLKSVKEVAKKHQLSPSHVRRLYYAAKSPVEKHGNSALSLEQEQQLILSILTLSSVHLSVTAKQVQDLTQVLFGVNLSKSTTYEFIKKNKDKFSFKKPTSLGAKREKEGLYEETLVFIEKMHTFFDHISFPAHAIVNYDESRVCLTNQNKLVIKHLMSKEKTKPQIKSKIPNTHCGTFLPFVSAAGELLATYFIFKGSFNEKQEIDLTISLPSSFRKTRGCPPPPKIYWSDSGYINTKIWEEIMSDFTCKWKVKYPGLYCCLIGDNLNVHHDLNVMKVALENHIYQCFLVQNTSHWSQPLDNLLFARLKQEISLSTQSNTYLQCFTSENIISLVDTVLQAVQKAFTPKTIISSFKETGLFPFDKEKIEKLARENHVHESSHYQPTEQVEYLREKTAAGIQTYMKTLQTKADEKSKTIKQVKVRVQKNKGFDVEEILHNVKLAELVVEKLQKTKEKAKEEQEKDRKRKREKEEREKEDRKRMKQEKRAEQEKKKEVLAHHQKAHTLPGKIRKSKNLRLKIAGFPLF